MKPQKILAVLLPVLIVVLLLTSPGALAGPDLPTLVPPDAYFQGDQHLGIASGVDVGFNCPPYYRLHVEQLSTDITPVAGIAGIKIERVCANGANGSGSDPPYTHGQDGGNGGSDDVGPWVQFTGDSQIIVTSGVNACGIVAGSQGGKGGNGADMPGAFGVEGGHGGWGGHGGPVSVSSDGTIQTQGKDAYGIFALSRGGDGGNGGDGYSLFYGAGGWGRAGGSGGTVSVSSDGTIQTQGDAGFGIFAESRGGNGGKGGDGGAAWGEGGCGGVGGTGGPVAVQSYGTIMTTGTAAGGILAQSLGGAGGSGGTGSGVVANGGSAQGSGPGGTIGVQNYGVILTSGGDARGIFAQSVGGHNGNPAGAGGLFSWGGNGESAGDGGNVTMLNAGAIATEGVGADSISVLSIGGGGGRARATGGLSSVGGVGSAGGNGGIIEITNSGPLETWGSTAFGIFAQSIGGGGGDGGSSGGAFSIGGGSSIGGQGGSVTVTNENQGPILNGAISTVGKDSAAIFAQSIGGGGGRAGDSGGALSFGGTGSGGGSGGEVTVTNGGQLVTSGERSCGIFAQSIGGGGGAGGSSGGAISFGGSGSGTGHGLAVTVTNLGDIQTLGVASQSIFAQSVGGGGGSGGGSGGLISFGASGGAAGNGAAVTLSNFGNLATANVDSSALFAQSVGGGGGNAGGSISVSAFAGFALGGKGGPGGNSGQVDVVSGNDLTINTLKDRSHGIFAQSLGGGGGNGGAAVTLTGGEGGSVSVAAGGAGGDGGDGNTVSVNSDSTIGTEGHDAYGIFAQSLGGGGGSGGFSIAGAGSDGVAVSISYGGSGGNGGHGKAVTVASTGALDTAGDRSYGLFAQSIGGGGGNGGFSIAGGGGGIGGGGISVGGFGGGGGNGDTVNVDSQSAITTLGDQAHGLFAQSVGGGGGNGGFSIAAGGGGTGAGAISVGGFGGLGGNSKSVTVNSSGNIGTSGYNAYGLFAQSIGGGGGNGGFSISGAGAGTCSGTVSVGGFGAGGGDSDIVQVTSESDITTGGEKAHALFAQSIGGGGGNGGFSLSFSGAGTGSGSIGVGGFAAEGGAGKSVTVSSSGILDTSGNGAIGLFAQSIGGGGGNGGFSISGSAAGTGSGAFSLGGGGGKGGQGDTVLVNSTSSITTGGADAYGIFAQSIGGGGGNGGFSIAGSGAGTGSGTINIGGFGGDGGNSKDVTVNNSGVITTNGDKAIGLFAQSVGGGGGNGSFSISASGAGTGSGALSLGGGGGKGGQGNAVLVDTEASSTITTRGVGAHGVFAQSIGGGGGNGGFSIVGSGAGTGSGTIGIGGFGGEGGNSEAVIVNSPGLIDTTGDNAIGLFAQSVGGGGGNGSFSISGSGAGTGSGAFSLGGGGGMGGQGNTVLVDSELSCSSSITTRGAEAHGIFAQSVGGGGGNGGFSIVGSGAGTGSGAIGIGGFGASGGSGMDVTIKSSGTVDTSGKGAIGLYAQSVGGGGGNGGFSISGSGAKTGSGAFSLGGSCVGGGDAGVVLVEASTNIVTRGENAYGMLVQSVGGGGGNGGFSVTGSGASSGSGSIGIGGFAGGGGAGQSVTVTSSGMIDTYGNGATGLLAQSVGGGGGTGGFSIAGSGAKTGSGTFSLGGGGGAGGIGQIVTVNSSADITTGGILAYGILAQSIGGGGGAGGFSFTGGVTTSGGGLNAAVGGFGGAGGEGGTVNLISSGSVTTTNSGAHAILAQSVGGGGGTGGFSGSVTAGTGSKPNVALSMGGWGGAGGSGQAVTLGNQANVRTEGTAAYGLFAQSVGGGGGDGGGSFSAALGSAQGGWNGSVSIGGSGGSAGNGGTVRINDNTGNILTEGIKSHGLVAQSVGGGGGNGGFSATGTLGVGTKAKDIAISVGGFGGAGGDGGIVEVLRNMGNITTQASFSGVIPDDLSGAEDPLDAFGNGAVGILAQSIGGGGGNGGFSFSGSLGSLESKKFAISVGGYGGAGGKGMGVTVDNEGLIGTKGANSHAILAQSIGGGGGTGGASVAIDFGISNMDGSNSNYALSVGGSGGSGNTAGVVDVTNRATLTTSGAFSDGILAQSIGGGGGTGGYSLTGTLSMEAEGEQTGGYGLTLGGWGGDGNHSGAVTVKNYATIDTAEHNSCGIFAQSVGGGGGKGGAARAIALKYDPDNVPSVDYLKNFLEDYLESSSESSSGLVVGGSGGAASNGSTISVTNTAAITTQGASSYGILAQSVGGGGGVGSDGTVGLPKVPNWINDLLANTPLDINAGSPTVVGGFDGSSGNGDAVIVDNQGSITTYGQQASGIFAQSTGGGGGVANSSAGGEVRIGGDGGAIGNGSDVTVTHVGQIETFGSEANGIDAQSVGGGGGKAGSVAEGIFHLGYNAILGRPGGGQGDGGAVNVQSEGNITTHGTGANGIFAQSVGGGGGVAGDIFRGIGFAGSVGGVGSGGTVNITHTGNIATLGDASYGIFAQSAGGTNLGGSVQITLDGAIDAQGEGSSGIVAQSRGDGSAGNISVTISAGSSVLGGSWDGIDVEKRGVGVRILDGVNNTLTNAGDISARSGLAIIGGTGNDTIFNSGTITGTVDLGTGTNAFDNQSAGIFNSAATVHLGAGNTFTNAGNLRPGGLGAVLETTLIGSLAQSDLGVLNIQLGGTAAGSFDRLNVTDSVQLDGTLEVALFEGFRPAHNDQFTILTFDSRVGDFATKQGLDLGNRLSLVPDYGGQSLVLNAVQGGSGRWRLDQDGAASVPGNWEGGIPNGIGDTATFGPVISGPRTVTIDTATTLGGMCFDNAQSYTIAGPGPVVLQSEGGEALIDVAAGTHQISTSLMLASDVVVSAAGDLEITGPISGSQRLRKSGMGTLLLTNANSYEGGTLVDGGVLRFDTAGAIPDSGAIDVKFGGTAATSPALFPTLLAKATTDSAGTVALSAASTGDVDMSSFPNLSLGAVGTVAFTNNLTPSGTTYRLGGGGGTLIFSPAITGANSLVVCGGGSGGVVVLTGANSYTGGTTINGGVLRFDIAGAIPDSGAIDVKFEGTAATSPALFPTLLAKVATDSAGTVALSADSTGDVDMSSFPNLSLGAVGTVTFTNNLTPSGTTYRLGGGGGTLIFSPAITGANSLVVCGGGSGGVVILTGAHTYTGGTTINEGILAYGADNVLPVTGPVNVAGGTLDVAAFNGIVGAVTLTRGSITGSTGVLTGTSYTVQKGSISANLGGAGVALTKTTTETVTLSGANTYTGETLVNGGTLDIATGGSVTNTNRVNAVNGATLMISGSLTMAENGVFAVGSGNGTMGTVVVKDGAVVNIGAGSGGTVGGTYIGGKIDNTGDIGIGTLTIDGGTVNVAAGGPRPDGDGTRLWLNPWGGSGSTINLNGGTLSTARPIANGAEGASVATVNLNGGILQAAGAIDLFEVQNPLSVYVQEGGAIIDTNGFNSTIAPTLQHGAGGPDGGLTKIGVGILTLTGDNTYNGATTITSGTLQVGDGGDTGTLGTGPIINHGSLVFNRAGDTVISSAITGNGSLTQQGNNTLLLTGANTYIGGTTLASGTVSFISGGLGPSGNIDFSGSATLQWNGTNTQDLSARLSIPDSVTATVDTMANSVTFASPLALAAGGLCKTGGGTLTFTEANLAGDVTISQGTIVANISSGVGPDDGNYGQNRVTSGKFVLGDTHTGSSEARLGLEAASTWPALYAANNDIEVAAGPTGRLVICRTSGTYAASVRGTVTLHNNVILRNEVNNNDLLSMEGKITGTGNVTIESVNPSGRVNLSNPANDWVGNLTVASGRLQLNGNYVIPATANVTINSGAQMSYNSGATTLQSIGGLSGGGAVNIGWGSTPCTLTVGNLDRNGSFSGAITGKIALVKTGTGTQTLSGNNDYTGGTTVNAGTLQGPAGSIQGNVNLTAPSAMLTFDQAAADGSYGDIVSGSGGLTKTGAKSLALFGNNTYTGMTTISEGTLKLGLSYTPNGAELWLDAAHTDSLAVNVDGTVGRWTSLVGSNYASIASGGPTYQTNVQNGQPVLRFSGSNPLTFADSLTADGTTMFIMFRTDTQLYTQPVDSSGIWLHLTDGANPGNRCAVTRGGDMRIQGASFPKASQWHVQEVQVKAGNWKLWVDDNLLGTNADGTTIGPFINVGGNMPGDIGEVLIYPGVLSDTVRTDIYKYLAAKWMGHQLSDSIPDTSPVTIALSATLDLTGYSETVGPLSGSGRVLVNGSTLTVNSTSDSEFSGMISGAGGILTKTGAGMLTLSGPNNYTGATLVQAGTLDIGPSGGLDNTGNINAAGTSGAVLSISGTVTMACGKAFGVGSGLTGATGTTTVNSGGVLTIGGGNGYTAIGGDFVNAAGTGRIGQVGVGTLNISGGIVNVAAAGTVNNGPGGTDATHLWLNPYGGSGGSGSTINLNSGTLSTARPIANGANTPAYFNFNGGTLRAAIGDINILDNINTLTVNVRDQGAIVDTNGFNTTITPALLHSTIGGDAAIDGGLTKIGLGTLTLSGANTFTGNLVINNGTLRDTVTVGNSNPTATGLGNMTIEGRTVTVNSGAKLLLDGQDGMGSYQYKTPVLLVADGGTIANGANKFMAIGDISLKNGGRLTTDNGSTASYQTFNLRGSVSVSGTSGSFISTTGTSNNGIHLGGTTVAATTFDVASTGDPLADLTVSVPLLNEVYGTGALVKSGNGTMLLTGANTYTGGTTVNAGTLQGPAGSIQGNVNLTAPSAKLTFDQAAADGSYGGIVSGSGGLTKTGAKSLALFGNNTYTGMTTISEGTLKLGYNPSGAELWLDAAHADSLAVNADGTGGPPAPGSTVCRWTSLVGSNYASIASGGPTYQTNVQNGQPVLRFSGSNPLTFADSLTADGTTMFIMFRTDSTNYTQPVDSSGTWLHQTDGVNHGNRCAVTGGGDVRIQGASFPKASQWHVQEVQVKAGNWALWIDNYLLGTNANNIMIGPFINVGGNMPGDIGEVLIYPGVLSDTVRTDIYNYLAAKWMGNPIPDTSPVAIAASATLDLAGYNETVGPLSGSGRVLLDKAVLTVNSVSDSEFSGMISGAGALTKTGPSTLTLSGTNTYSGCTTVSEGALQINTGAALTLHSISGAGTLVVDNATSLTVDSISLGTLTIGTGSTVIIAPIPGGPLAESGSVSSVPEPSMWAMLILAVMGLGIYRYRSR